MRKLEGLPQAHATPHIPLFQPRLCYPLLSCLHSMHKKDTPRLKGGRGEILTKLICCFEHYNGLILYFITDSYLLLASLSVGFLYILVQNRTFSILTHNIIQKTMYKIHRTRHKMTKSAQTILLPPNGAFEPSYLPTD